MAFRTTFSTKPPSGRLRGAFTLIEYLIGIGIGSLVLLTILSLSLYSGKSFAGQAKVLLTQCDDLRFAIYQRTPLPGTYDQYPVAAVTNCKVVAVKWVCSRTILGAKVNSEDIQEAKIVIRKH